MKYILKPGQERFQAVDGRLAGRKYRPGVEYDEIPVGESARFIKIAPKKVKHVEKESEK